MHTLASARTLPEELILTAPATSRLRWKNPKSKGLMARMIHLTGYNVSKTSWFSVFDHKTYLMVEEMKMCRKSRYATGWLIELYREAGHMFIVDFCQ